MIKKEQDSINISKSLGTCSNIQTDSVYIFNLSNSCKIEKYGYARNEDTDLLIVK